MMKNERIRRSRWCIPMVGSPVQMLVMLVAWAIGHPVIAQSDTPQWRFEPDDRFQIEIEQNTEMSSVVDQRSQTSKNQMTLSMTWRVESVDEHGVATLAQTLDRIRLTAQVPTPTGDRQVDLDTDNPQGLKGLSKKLYKLVAPLVGTEATVQIDSRGKIRSVEVPPESAEVLRYAPASMQIRNVLTDEGIRQLFGLATVELPDADLNEQPDWTVRKKLNSALGRFDQVLEYTARRDEDTGDFVIEMVNRVNPQGEREGQGESSESELKRFTGQGSYRFDVRQGILADGDVTSELETERDYHDLTIQTTVKSQMKLSVKRMNDE